MLTYQTFMKHAVKVTKTAPKARPVLSGVYHHPDGSLCVTDGFRLYKVEGIEHDKVPGSVYTPNGKKIDEPYPNIDRLAQLPDNCQEYQLKTKTFFEAVNLVSTISIVMKETPILHFKGNQIRCTTSTGEQAVYHFPIEFEGFVLNGQFLLDALNLFKAAKCEEVKLLFINRLRPIFLIAGNLTILILPIRY